MSPRSSVPPAPDPLPTKISPLAGLIVAASGYTPAAKQNVVFTGLLETIVANDGASTGATATPVHPAGPEAAAEVDATDSTIQTSASAAAKLNTRMIQPPVDAMKPAPVIGTGRSGVEPRVRPPLE